MTAEFRRSDYLGRLRARQRDEALARAAGFGQGLGLAMAIAGGMRAAFVPESHDGPWRFVACVGLALIVLGTVVPQMLSWPERGFRCIGERVGGALLGALLAVVFAVAVWPVGAILRRRAVGRRFASWRPGEPAVEVGWLQRGTPGAAGSRSGRRLPLALRPFMLVGGFVRRGNLLLLPVLVLLVALGVLLFVVQSSALAPFLYPLF